MAIGLLLNWRLWAALVVAGFLAATHWKAYVAGKHAVQAEWEAQRAEDRKAIDDANARANSSAALYEKAKAQRITRTVVVTKEINHAIETAPDWAAVELPRGVRDAITTAAAPIDPGQPDGALPVPAAGSEDERGSGPGLRLEPRRFGGLLGPAPGPQ